MWFDEQHRLKRAFTGVFCTSPHGVLRFARFHPHIPCLSTPCDLGRPARPWKPRRDPLIIMGQPPVESRQRDHHFRRSCPLVLQQRRYVRPTVVGASITTCSECCQLVRGLRKCMGWSHAALIRFTRFQLDFAKVVASSELGTYSDRSCIKMRGCVYH